jgi:hypothetical protein
MSEHSGRDFLRKVMDYLGLESDEEHNYPGHICGIDCDRRVKGQSRVRWWDDPVRGQWWIIYGEVLFTMLVIDRVIDAVSPVLLSRDQLSFINLALFTLVWLGMRRISRRMAEVSHREANRLAWMTKAARKLLWLYPLFMAATLGVVFILNLLHW